MAGERVERRLAAILAADVAGYSRLMGADEVGTLAALKAIRREVVDPTLAEHRGRIVKTTGDGLLVEFASAVDAVSCATALQDQIAKSDKEPRISFRIGINIGDIIIDGGDLFGDGVNIAARLEGIAPPGGICVSSSAYEQVRGKVPVDFVDLGEQTLKNISRPIRTYAVGSSATGAQQVSPPTSSAPHLSIVVLPFANIGGDPEQEYFVDGVTESLTTDLSRIAGAFVIARNTAFTFKGRAVDVKKLGHELNVRYVLEGSVQRGDSRLRMNVQLIDAETSNHVWAERFDKPLGDLFDLQDEIVSRLANTLNAELIAAEARRAERSPHPDAMDLYFQGRAFMNKGSTPTFNEQAHKFFERALIADPHNVEALVGSADANLMRANNYFDDDPANLLRTAEITVSKALSLAPDHPWAHRTLGYILGFTDRVDQGIAKCERALTLDRNLADAHGTIGLLKYFIGRGEETEVHCREALKLSPRDQRIYSWLLYVGVANLWRGKDAEAVTSLTQSTHANPNYPLALIYLSAALAHSGRLNEARTAAQAGLALNPGFTIARYRASAHCSHPAFLAGRERTYEGLRLAGVPEG